MQRYMGKISGPLLDRIDIHIEVEPVPFEKLSDTRSEESSESIRKRVSAAREHQTLRFEAHPNINYNAPDEYPSNPQVLQIGFYVFGFIKKSHGTFVAFRAGV